MPAGRPTEPVPKDDQWGELRWINEKRAELDAIPQEERSPEQESLIKELSRKYFSYIGGGV